MGAKENLNAHTPADIQKVTVTHHLLRIVPVPNGTSRPTSGKTAKVKARPSSRASLAVHPSTAERSFT